MDESAVQEAITQVSQEDRHEAVRARAERYLPKVQTLLEGAPKPPGLLLQAKRND